MAAHGYMPPRLDLFSAGSPSRMVTAAVRTAEAETSNEPAPLGPGGTPAVVDPVETAERCARHADELASEVEATLRLLRSDLEAGDRLAWELASELRAVASGLGEVHTVLDELTHELSWPGGVS